MTPTARATYFVEIAWSGDLTGVITLGRSTIGGSDVLGGTFGLNAYDDVSLLVRRVTYRRGKSSSLGSVQAGSCTIVLEDLNGDFNPANPASPYAASLDVLRPVRVRATHGALLSGSDADAIARGLALPEDAGAVGLFHGFIRDIWHNPAHGARETTIECVDAFEWLALATPTIASAGATTTGAAAGRILDAVEWTEVAKRDLDTGDSIPDFSAAGSATALALVQALVAPELGAVFVDGDGVITYQDRTARWSRRAADATWDGVSLTAAQPRLTLDGIVTRQTVTRDGGAAQTATDETARRRYGYRDGSAITTPYLATDGEALSRARLLVALQSSPRVPVDAVRLINGTTDLLVQLLRREIGDRVTVSETRGGTSTTGTIEGLSATISEGNTLHTADYVVARLEVHLLTLGQSTIGGADILG